MTYLVLDSQGEAVAEEYASYDEAYIHAERIGGWVTECLEYEPEVH